MKDRRMLAIGVAALVLVALLVSPAIGGPSLKKLVKKEVSKQLKGKQGPQGAPGVAGANRVRARRSNRSSRSACGMSTRKVRMSEPVLWVVVMRARYEPYRNT